MICNDHDHLHKSLHKITCSRNLNTCSTNKQNYLNTWQPNLHGSLIAYIAPIKALTLFCTSLITGATQEYYLRTCLNEFSSSHLVGIHLVYISVRLFGHTGNRNQFYTLITDHREETKLMSR